MATKASDRVTLQVLPTPNNVRLYYLKQASTLNAPTKPTANPPTDAWTTTEPTFTEGSTDTVYTTMLTVWGDASYQYGDVQKSAAFEAAKQAFNKADSAATVAANLRTAIDLGLMRTGKASSPPAVGKGLTWAVLDEDTGTKVVGLRIANAAGTAWTPYQIIAEDIMVVGAGGTVRLKNGVVDADTILANEALIQKLATPEFWATLATVENLVVTSKMLGNEIEGKVFKGGLVKGAAIQTESLTIGASGGTETVALSDTFEANVTGWAGSSATVARTTGSKRSGSYGMRVTKPTGGVGGNTWTSIGATRTCDVTVTAGSTVTAWVRATEAATFSVLLVTTTGKRYSTTVDAPTANTWTQLVATLPSPGILSSISISGSIPMGTLGGFDVDDVQVSVVTPAPGAAQLYVNESGTAVLKAAGKTAIVQDLIDAALRPAPQMGYHQHSAGIANGSAVSGTITFPQPFASPPIVVGTSRSGRLNLQINQATATGFTWFLRNDSGAAAVQADSGFQWIAMN